MKRNLKHISRLVLYSLLSFVIVISNYDSAAAYLINKNYVEQGITQFDERVTSNQDSCSDFPPSNDGGDIGNINVGNDPKERRVNLIKLFMSTFNLTAPQAAGIVGNFAVEAGSYASDDSPGVRPDINQNHSGSATGQAPLPGSLGYGWAQWSGSRKTAFVRFLNENPQWVNEGRATDMANAQYLKKELETTYRSTLPALRNTTNPNTAMRSFEATFERAGTPNYTERQRWAEQSYREYQAAGNDDGSTNLDNPSGTPPSCNDDDGGGIGTAPSARFDEVAFPLKGTKQVVLNPGMFHDGTADLGGHNYTAYDIMTDAGTEVVAFAAGEVTYTSVDRCGGKFLTIWNEQARLGVTYMHMSDHIREGARVRAGDHVGTIGTSDGAACGTGAHLHIDVATDRIRQGCSRLSCTIQHHFRSIGRDLYNTYQALPDR